MVALTLFALLLIPARAEVSPGVELSRRAGELHLAQERYWRLLLHYGPLAWGKGSEAQNREFFLAPNGRYDAQAELEADVHSLFETPPQDDDGFACRFPARAAWLVEKLGIRPEQLPKRVCFKYVDWRTDLKASSATLVFASAYLNNPSSMYGHTFLRLDQAQHKQTDRLLDYAVNFSAIADTNNGVLFAVYGLLGFFPGKFSATPYYLKVQEYSNLESRDLWEYRLSLSSAAIDRLAAHIWEMGKAEFPYYFFNKNCSYQLLPLLEVANPDLRLTDGWPAYVVPIDTVRALIDHGLVADVTYRPSRVTTLLARRRLLGERELRLAARMIEPNDADWAELNALAPERRAAVLDSSLDYFQHRIDFRPKRENESKDMSRALLVARGQTGVASAPLRVLPPVAPHEGHPTHRASIGYGFGDRRFIEASLRAALHDMLDPSPGYAPGSELAMLDAKARFDVNDRRAYLQSLDLARILSLTPLDPWIKHPSWKLDVGVRNAWELDARPWKTNYFGVGAGSGLAYETHLWNRELFYALAEGDCGAGGIFRNNHRIGVGASAAVVAQLADRVKAKFESRSISYFLGDPRPLGQLAAEASYELPKNTSIRARAARTGRRDEAVFNLAVYF